MSFQNDVILKKSLKLSMETNIDQIFLQTENTQQFITVRRIEL